jgi:hypothetical protein
MRNRILLLLVVGVLAFTIPVFGQVSTKTGSIYGKVVDDKGAPLPGVGITLESNVIPAQVAQSGPAGGFRFANLPPGDYSVNFSLEGFTEVRQEEVRVSTGSQTQLEITLKPSLAEEFTVIGEAPVVDTTKTGTSSSFSREYLEDVPSARDPWVIIDQTTGVDLDRYNVAGSESGQQAGFVARGANDDNTLWNYDGVNATDPAALGASPTYFDFDSFEELQIATGGNDASVQTGGVIVNIVTKRAGNKWEGNGSFYFVNDSLQGENTPDELKQNPILDANGNPIEKGVHLDEVKDYGFDVGGPIIKDKLFAWGAYHKNNISLITITNQPDITELIDYNFKANFNWTAAHESQFGYFNGDKTKQGRGFNPAVQAPETLWNQGGTETILPGIWTGQHTWIPNDHTIISGRYGYIGLGFGLHPAAGNDHPIIYLSAVPHYEETYVDFFTDRPAHDIVVDANYFRENLMGGDHELKFGFEYKTADVRSYTIYGNGQYIYDFYQEAANGPLTSGYLFTFSDVVGLTNVKRTSFYVNDTFRKDRLTLNLGFRVDNQKAENLASSRPANLFVPDLVPAFSFDGSDVSVKFTDFAPRLGLTYDLTGDGKTIIRGNFARYYDQYNAGYATFTNPTFAYGIGALLTYNNSNGDRTITRDETSFVTFLGGFTDHGFDPATFLSLRTYDPDLKNGSANEYIAGFERQLGKDWSVSVDYTHRDYFDTTAFLPEGVTSADYHQAGTLDLNTVLGHFSVPYFTLNAAHSGVRVLSNIPDYKQHYNGVDISVRKRMADNFMINAGLTVQSQKSSFDSALGAGYTIGEGSSGIIFPFSPSNVRAFDGQPYAYVSGGSGKTNVYPFAERTFKLSGVYQFPWDFSVGAFARFQQGFPQFLLAGVRDTSFSRTYSTTTQLVPVEPFGDRRYDDLFTLDLQFEKGFDFAQYGRLAVSANLFNVTNTNTIIRRNNVATSLTFNRIEENISPRAVRLGVRYSF